MVEDKKKNAAGSDRLEYDNVYGILSEEETGRVSEGITAEDSEYEVEVVELDSEFEVDTVEVELDSEFFVSAVSAEAVSSDSGKYQAQETGGGSAGFAEPVLDVVSAEDDTEFDDDSESLAGGQNENILPVSAEVDSGRIPLNLRGRMKNDPLGSAVILLFLLYVILFVVYLIKNLP